VKNFGYLLEKRYGSMLQLHLDPPMKNALIIPLTLQMLVENAVKHNVITEEQPLNVYISIDSDDYITVKNNRQPKTKSEPSTKFGLQSIVKRYQVLTDRKVVIENDQHSFKVRIPIIKNS
jgi:LytS/YehU family sensor histidine kinase